MQGAVGYLDVASRLQQADSKLLVTSRSLFHIAEPASRVAGKVPLLSLDTASSSVPSVADLLPVGNSRFGAFKIDSFTGAETTGAFLNRTSGSTGNMKSVITTHGHFNATLAATFLTVPDNTDPEKDVWVSPMSLGFFINAKLHMGLNILLGIPVVLMEAPFSSESMSVLARHRVTFLFITPPVAAELAKVEKKIGDSVDVTSIKWLLSAGAPMHESLRDTVSKQLNGVRLYLEWGTSETLLIAIQNDEASCVPDSSGKLVNGMEAKVIDVSTGTELGPGEEGEILVRNSLATFAGYKDNELANRDFDSEGWFHTGDSGYLDEKCNVFIKDRLTELLRVGDGYGSRISATELEEVIFKHVAVKSVVVVGVHDHSAHVDYPTAFIILRPGYQHQSPNELAKEIETFARQELAGLRQLTGGCYFVNRYPQNGFKINRRQLKSLIDVGEKRLEQPRYIEIA